MNEIKSLPFPLTPNLKKIVEHLSQKNAEVTLVGGSVRNFLLGLPLTDYDLEITNLKLTDLEKNLKELGTVHLVGKSFGIFKCEIDGEIFDIAIPRTEQKIQKGHQGFHIHHYPHLSFYEASKRRDFTVNAMGINLTKGCEFLDPHGGKKDLDARILRHVSDAFSEDPLRVLRACQFAARFNFKIHPETIKKCRELKEELFSLPSERIAEEIKKMLLSLRPSLAFHYLKETYALSLFPELESLINCPQNPQWHPEGDVWIHTLMALDQGSQIIRDKSLDLNSYEQLLIQIAVLCHDLGKPSTTKIIDGKITSRNHEQAGESFITSFLNRSGLYHQFFKDVVPLVQEHLKPILLHKDREKIKKSTLKRLATKVNLKYLALVSKADILGRTTEEAKKGMAPGPDWLMDEAKKLNVLEKAEPPLLMGRHLENLGFAPGPHYKKILDDVYNAQLEGEFKTQEEAILWVKTNYSSAI